MIKPYYEEENIKIYCGDCLEIMPEIGERVNLILTDPPYNVGFDEWDSFEDTDKLFSLFEGKEILIIPGIANIFKYPEPKWIIAWVKAGSTRRNITGGFNHWEPVFYYGERKIMVDMIYLPDCVNHSQGNIHPCPKPLKLFKWLLSSLSFCDDLILDPFMGSGTTLVAAKELRRKAVGIDIERKYCDIAIQRLRQEVISFDKIS